jgi:hypothetical protein
MRVRATAVALTSAAALSACGGDDDGSLPVAAEHVELDPSGMTTQIDNPFWPMTPGARWVYRERGVDGSEQRVVVTVTGRTREVMGITALVVHDLVTEDGAAVEDTYDWYAQDDDGNVWYLGEDTKEYENGKVTSTEGSWEAGVDGAEPGIAIPAEPEPGLGYRQEYKANVAEDRATVLGTDERVSVQAGSWKHALLTKDSTPLEPDVVEYKLYAPGVGPVLALDVSGGSSREELVRYSIP